MKKRLDTRFPAARIKKIMQADEDVGKIAMAVPLLMSKALELFLQDLCDRTYEITLKRGAKTMNSLHLKHCIQTFNVFDFLKEVVRKVPDMGSSETVGEDRGVVKRRRVVNDGQVDSDDESKRSHLHDSGHTNSAGRGRGRGRGRPRGRGGRTAERDANMQQEKYEDDIFIAEQEDRNVALDKLCKDEDLEDSKEKLQTNRSVDMPVRNFDLNVGLDENGDSHVPLPPAPTNPSDSGHELKHEEYPGWSLSEVEKMAFDPMQLARLNNRIDDEEDYDEEG